MDRFGAMAGWAAIAKSFAAFLVVSTLITVTAIGFVPGPADACDFTFLRDQLQLGDSDLSRHMTALNQAGYVTIRKSGHGRGSTTTYAITTLGRTAYGRHRATLTALLAAHGPLSS